MLSGARGGGGDLLSRFRSIIGARGFNFSVRNGKRWSPPAVAALSRLCAVRLGGYGFRRAPAALWGLRLRMRRCCGRGGGVHEGSLGDARRACGGAASCARGRTLSEEESRGRERADADACPAAVAAALLPCVLFFRPPPFGGGGRIWERVRAISIARLWASPPLHLRPIDVVVSDGPSKMDILSLRGLRA